MSNVADRFVVVLDANVLYPFRVRDVLLRFAEAGLYRARWSAQILDEWTRSLLRNKPQLEKSVHAQVAAMARAFPEAIIEGHDSLVPSLELPDEGDRHVLAAAIQAGAQHIITENVKDFPLAILKEYDTEAVTADQFLASTFELYPSHAVAALRKMRLDYESPRMTASELILDLMRAGLGNTAAMAKAEIESL